MIELRAVTKAYGNGPNGVLALKGIDVSVPSGQFVSIMGPSGSGKSTLLNLVSALDTPSSGSIVIDGEDISKLDDDALTVFRRRRIGLIFQFFNLLPTLSVLDNTLLPLMIERKLTGADRQRAVQLLERVGLGQRSSHHIHQLSGGQMQRVGIARALIMEPRLILADEPTGNLDSATGASILQLLCETRDTTGTTIVMVTHDRNAARVGERVISLKDGQIVSDQQTRRSASDEGSGQRVSKRCRLSPLPCVE
jgi:putative ABC transport system ATP-binding protein